MTALQYDHCETPHWNGVGLACFVLADHYSFLWITTVYLLYTQTSRSPIHQSEAFLVYGFGRLELSTEELLLPLFSISNRVWRKSVSSVS
jgi:hypothetical protein